MSFYFIYNDGNSPVSIYISIYDKKPRKKHVFIYVLPDEEKRERARESAKKYYNNNRKEINAKHALYRESVKSKKKNL